MDLGIGINTGMARVGNTGSQHKFKYGPLGNTVNLASRVQGATKYLKCRLLITGATQAKLDDSFAAAPLVHRCGCVNIAEPVDTVRVGRLATSRAGPRPRWSTRRPWRRSRAGIFTWPPASWATGGWPSTRRWAGPGAAVRAVKCMVEEPASFDPVWVLPGK